MTLIILFAALISSQTSFAAFSNYNSILIGDRAAGMGGAITALSDDPSAAPFYNPATLARLVGSNFSTSASVYHKYDTAYGDLSQFKEAPRRINQGTFKAIPSASGTVQAFGLFALTFSIVFPDFDYFVGPVKSQNGDSSYLNFSDESLWVGGSLAFNLDPKTSIGLTMYYTARAFYRSVSDQEETAPGVLTKIDEEKAFTNNSMVYILGGYHQLNDNWSIGVSYRFPSLEIAGRGSYYKTTLVTSPYNLEEISMSDLKSDTKIPPKFTIGVGYKQSKKWLVGLDISYFGPTSYDDIQVEESADHVVHRPVINTALGIEYYLNSWSSLRMGFYTNYSSHPSPDVDADPRRQGDHLDMWGFSSNLALYTSKQTSFTFGGYYTGGLGSSTQIIGNEVVAVPKSQQIFSMLIASSYFF